MITLNIREIQLQDDPAIAQVIRDVLIEHDVPKVGTAYADPELDRMTETYSSARSKYFVVEKDDKIVGGAGIAPLLGGDPNTCELQKMYFLSDARGLGIGSLLMEKCLDAAREFAFKKCYLETMPYMEAARRLYTKAGFECIEKPLGNTGHNACLVWMIKDLDS
jgi:putative acetyltransferase